MRKPGARQQDARHLGTFAQIVFGILVLMAALIAFVGPLGLPLASG